MMMSWNPRTLEPTLSCLARRGLAWFVALLIVAGLSVGPAMAHKVYVFAWVENGRVYTEGSFGDQPVKLGEIRVTDSAGNVVAEGTTDDKGTFSFAVPENVDSDLSVLLKAGMGHQAEWTVRKDEMTAKSDQEAEAQADASMKKKTEIEKKPGLTNILSGLAVIFAIAFTASAFYRLRKSRRDND